MTFLAALFGYACIDLRDAAIADEGIDINVFAMYGSAEVILPPDATVKVLGISLFGAVQHAKDATVPHGPLVRIHAVAIFGGIRIGRKPLWQPDPSSDDQRSEDAKKRKDAGSRD